MSSQLNKCLPVCVFRFLRHVPVIYVDHPGAASLKQIYGTFNRAMLRLVPSLRPYADPLTNAMVDFYIQSQDKFTQDMQPHYIYSPREMSRWVRGICEALRPLENLAGEGLVRIWAHEALRLFQVSFLIEFLQVRNILHIYVLRIDLLPRKKEFGLKKI